MWRFILYLFPLLSNMLTSGIFFITAYRFSEAGSNKLLVTCTCSMWGLTYSLLSTPIGRITTPKRAPLLLTSATIMMLVCIGGFVFFPNLYLQYLWIAVSAVASALFTVPFQVFSKSLEGGKTEGVARTSALYNLSWSIGFALGSTLFGIFKNLNAAFALCTALPLTMLAGIFVLMKLNKKGPEEQMETPQGDISQHAAQQEFQGRPDLARIGWFGAILGTITISFIRTLEPNLAVQENISQFHAGLILATVSFVQAFVAFSFINSRNWMYRPGAFTLCGMLGTAGLLLYAFCPVTLLLYVGSILYGICSGMFFFLTIFHSQAHPTKNAQYVATNETLIGFASIIGPILGGILAQQLSLKTTFALGAIIMSIMGICQFILVKKANGNFPETADTSAH